VFENETPVAWTVMPEHVPVVGADGSELGIAEEVLGDREEDIFHGIVMRRRDGQLVELLAEHVRKTTEQHVVTDLTGSDAEALSAYRRR